MSSNPPTQFEQHELLHKELLSNFIVHSCINCDDFNEANETCSQVNQRPPAKIVVFGCPKWTPSIPF